ncbi:hypothetical protein QCMSULEJ_CDS0086 [Escherichia phage KS_W4]
MEVTEAAKRMVKFYVGSDSPLIRAFGQELYVFQGNREEAEEVAQKILDLQEKAKRADALEAEWRAQEERAENAETNLVDMRAAEHALSDSYIRLRQIVGAMNPPGVTSEEVWAHTEKKAQELRDRCEALEAVAKDFLRRNKYGPLFYRDLYNRFKEIVE